MRRALRPADRSSMKRGNGDCTKLTSKPPYGDLREEGSTRWIDCDYVPAATVTRRAQAAISVVSVRNSKKSYPAAGRNPVGDAPFPDMCTASHSADSRCLNAQSDAQPLLQKKKKKIQCDARQTWRDWPGRPLLGRNSRRGVRRTWPTASHRPSIEKAVAPFAARRRAIRYGSAVPGRRCSLYCAADRAQGS